MGWFDSDYEAQGSTSISQLGQQRHHDDTYLGDLILSNTHTGKNIPENIKDEIFTGTTAFMRRYYKKGQRLNFKSSIIYPVSKSKNQYLNMISVTRDIKSLGIYSHGAISTRNVELGSNTSYSPSPAPARWLGTEITREFTINTIDITTWKTIKIINFDLSDGTTVNTGIVLGAQNTDGFFATYTASDDRQYLFYSTEPQFQENQIGGTTEAHLMPVISIKDNQNTEWVSGSNASGFHPQEVPYYANPDTSAQLNDRVDMLDTLGADFKELSKSIFEPEVIPNIGTVDWNSKYGNLWDSASKACARGKAPKDQQVICDFGSEVAWRDNMVANQSKQNSSTKSITDVYVGFFVSMQTLDLANVTALFLTLQPLMGTLLRADTEERQLMWLQNIPSLDSNFRFEMSAGTLKIKYSMNDYSYIRRRGVVKYPWETITKVRNKKGGFEINTGSLLDDSDPIINIIQPLTGVTETSTNEFDDTGYVPWTAEDDLCLQLRMQDIPDAAGNPTYLEIRLYGLWAEHKIDVMRDTAEGQAESVAVRGGLSLDMDANDFEDIIVFPISKYAIDGMPTFLRERLARESLCMIVDGITVTEIKWYQQGWFQIFMFIVAVVLSVVTSGLSINAINLLTAAVKIGIATIVAQYILTLVENPLLAALLVVVLAVITGNYSPSNFMDMAMLAVEATGTYLQRKMAQDMLKLQEEYEQLQGEMSDAKKQMKEIEEVTGLNKKDDSSMILWLATLPPTNEDTDSWFNRVLDTNLNTIDIDSKLELTLDIKGL